MVQWSQHLSWKKRKIRRHRTHAPSRLWTPQILRARLSQCTRETRWFLNEIFQHNAVYRQALKTDLGTFSIRSQYSSHWATGPPSSSWFLFVLAGWKTLRLQLGDIIRKTENEGFFPLARTWQNKQFIITTVILDVRPSLNTSLSHSFLPHTPILSLTLTAHSSGDVIMRTGLEENVNFNTNLCCSNTIFVLCLTTMHYY